MATLDSEDIGGFNDFTTFGFLSTIRLHRRAQATVSPKKSTIPDSKTSPIQIILPCSQIPHSFKQFLETWKNDTLTSPVGPLHGSDQSKSQRIPDIEPDPGSFQCQLHDSNGRSFPPTQEAFSVSSMSLIADSSALHRTTGCISKPRHPFYDPNPQF